MALHLTTTHSPVLQTHCSAGGLASSCPQRALFLQRRQQATRLRRVLVRAEEQAQEQDAAPTESSLFSSGSGKITGSLSFTQDKEGFQDVFAFAGELPERLNGRVAMWSFAAIALAEWQSGKTALQQAVEHPVAAISFGLLISVASLAPKFAAGVSLKDLHSAASKDGLPKVLAFFNKTHELWLGRIAMLGITGLAIVEGVRGTATF